MRVTLWCISVCLILSFGFSTSPVSAQYISEDFLIQSWDVEDGLPVNEVIDIESTDDGYLWLTTLDGLVRFDGNRFTIYNKGQYPELVSNRLQLLIQRNATLWMRAELVGGSEYIIRFKDNEFTSFGPDEGVIGTVSHLWSTDEEMWLSSSESMLEFDGERFIPLFEDEITEPIGLFTNFPDGTLWFLTRSGKLFSFIDGEKKYYTTEDRLWSDTIRSFQQIGKKELWVLTDQGVNVISDEGVARITLPDNIDIGNIRRIIEDQTNPKRVMFLTANREKMYAYFEGDFQEIDLTGEAATNIILIGGGSTEATSDWYKVENLLIHKGAIVYSHSSTIHNFYPDKEGGVWISSSSGLAHVRKKLFTSYDDESHGISNVYPVSEDHEGVIWTANIGYDVYALQNGEITNPDVYAGGLSRHRIFSIVEDDEQNLWFGHSYGALKWDRKNNAEIVSTPFDEFNDQIRAIYQSKKGDMWFGGTHGAFLLDALGEWTAFKDVDGAELKGTRVISESANGTIWFGTNGKGLFYYANETMYPFSGNSSLSDNIVRSIYEDSEGVLWVGMEGGGLNRIENPLTEPTITHYGLDDGLFDTVIHTILEDSKERFWMSGNRGIFWVRKENLNAFAKGESEYIHSTYYSVKDGLPGNEANGGMQSTGLIAKDSTFYFPMVSGLASVKANEVSYDSEASKVLIEELISGDAKFINPDNSIQLNNDQRDIQFTYTSINYRVNPGSISFRYRLTNDTGDWVNAGSRREAFFTNVSSGSHIFEVQASLDGNNWGDSTTFGFSITPYFYETVWFKFLIALLALAIGYVLVKLRVRQVELREEKLIELVDQQTHQLKAQAERLRELDKTKSRFFANVSHEFRTPLTLIIGPLEDLQKKGDSDITDWVREKSSLALRNSKRLLRLVNQILDVSKIESGNITVEAEEQDIIEYLRTLSQVFVGLAERKKITYKQDFPSHPIPLWFDATMMEKIVANLLSNAFKFTPKGGEISITVKEKEEIVEISVSDNGPGIPAKEQEHVFDRFYQTGESNSIKQVGTGIGLSLVKELVDVHQGTIEVESNGVDGSRFIVRLKKGNQHFSEHAILHEPETEARYEPGIEILGQAEEALIETASHTSEDQPKILLIDDNAEIRAYIRGHIEGKYQVIEAENGREGIDQAKAELPDVVICDVMMPEMDGFEFTQALKSNSETDFIPVILLTAKADRADKMEGLGFGADDYIMKPFDVEEVILKIANLIARHSKLKARFSFSEMGLEYDVTTPKGEFLESLKLLMEEHLGNEELNVEFLVEHMAMSRTAFFGKMKEFVGKSPAGFIRDARLEHARELLTQNAGNITEIAYSVGFKSVAQFSRAFKTKFGTSPSSYQNTTD